MKRIEPLNVTLQGGDRRSIGNSNQVAALILRNSHRLAELMECLWDSDPTVRMRAADAVASARDDGDLSVEQAHGS